MIVSHKYKFIFIKTTKTAGTSIEIALSRFCGPADIITPMVPEDEKIRQNLGYPGAQNYLAPFFDYGLKDLARLIIRRNLKLRFYNHISAREIRHYLGREIWNQYYKFCVERNPWDRVLSLYYWHYKQESRPLLKEFLDTDLPYQLLKKRGFNLYTIDNKIAVDQICFYENMDNDLRQVSSRLSLPEELILPQAKSSYRKDRGDYRKVLSSREKEKISNLFAEEIALFGYRF